MHPSSHEKKNKCYIWTFDSNHSRMQYAKLSQNILLIPTSRDTRNAVYDLFFFGLPRRGVSVSLFLPRRVVLVFRFLLTEPLSDALSSSLL
mmetsp:Transcript_12560/g.30918  ORF Transcript_12560/g.30918 Transcript_12560/m.30918 type:complete len:91 (+) Transcript_12560:63-335(+)